MPAYYASIKALDSLDKKSIQEMKSFANPPQVRAATCLKTMPQLCYKVTVATLAQFVAWVDSHQEFSWVALPMLMLTILYRLRMLFVLKMWLKDKYRWDIFVCKCLIILIFGA